MVAPSMTSPRQVPGGKPGAGTTFDSQHPGGFWVVLNTTLRELNVGQQFKLFARYKDGSRRSRLGYRSKTPEGTRLRRAYLRVRNHALGPCADVRIEFLPREPVDFRGLLTVVEHLKGGVTMVRDEGYRLAPLWSGMKLQQRTEYVHPDGSKQTFKHGPRAAGGAR
jgi:hypothetical protein